jgi:hypothetical protein
MKASPSFKMPKKLKLGSVLGSDLIPVTSQSRGTSLYHMEDRCIDDDKVRERTKVERALQTVMAKWNQLEANFHLIYIEFESTGRSKTMYRNSISKMLGDIQAAIRGTDAKMQLLGAGLGDKITKKEEGPMSVWEAIQLPTITGQGHSDTWRRSTALSR